MILKDINLDDYLFKKEDSLNDNERKRVSKVLLKEMQEIYFHENLSEIKQ